MEELSFGYWLRLKRKALDLTQDALADRVGCSVGMIRKIESQERRPSAQIVERLAAIFSIPQNEQTAFLRFARGELKLTPAETEEDFPWHTTIKPTRSNLPAAVTSFIGREQEIVEVRDDLLSPKIRLVTLIGPPGIGKTRLSIESARAVLPDFQDGIFFVALATLENPTLIAVTIAQTLGFIGVRNISVKQQLKENIGEKQMLIVLDNCEHLIEDVASLASELLSACSRLKILATSRESLRIAGEWLYPVSAFDLPGDGSSVDLANAFKFPALMLFAERSRAVQPDFVLTAENIETVCMICSHLDGLPLAIELIAARTRLMSPRSLLARLNDQFILSSVGIRATSSRQKTLNDAIGWSYHLLLPEEQSLFAYLSVFLGSFSLDAAESIFARTMSEKSVPELISSLLDKSLLQRVINQDEIFYTVLVTIQDFARQRLRKRGEETEVRNWHLAYFLDLAEQADKELHGPHQLTWIHRLEVMRDNLRVALEWAIETGQIETVLRMARKLHWFWFMLGDFTEGRQWLGRALQMSGAVAYPEAQAEALIQLATHIVIQTGNKEARPFVEQGLSIARAQKDTHQTAWALDILGLVLRNEEKFPAAKSAFEESKHLFQEVHDDWGSSHALMCLGLLSWREEEWATALSLSQQALAGFQELGDRYFQCVTLRHVGRAYVHLSDFTNGIAALQESLILAQQFHSKYELGQTLWQFAEAATYGDQPARAICLYQAAKNILGHIGVWQQADDMEVENQLAACRAALSEFAFAEAVEQCRSMTLEQAITYALKWSASE